MLIMRNPIASAVTQEVLASDSSKASKKADYMTPAQYWIPMTEKATMKTPGTMACQA